MEGSVSRQPVVSKADLFEARKIEPVEIGDLMGGAPEDAVLYAQPLPYAVGERILRSQRENGAGGSVEIDVAEIYDDLLIYGIVDEKGNRYFDEEDRERVRNLPFAPATRLAMTVMRMSGLVGEEDEVEEPSPPGDDEGN